MTHFRTILMTAGLGLALVACGDRQANIAQQPDANPAATIPTAANEAAAKDFVDKTVQDDLMKMETAKIALERASNEDVKRYAQMMIDMHEKSTHDLTAAIASSGKPLVIPAALTEDRAAKVAEMKEIKAEDFDLEYIDEQVDGHQATLNLMQRYANDGDVPAIQAFAAANAALAQEHYDRASDLRNKLRQTMASNDGPVRK